MLKPLRHLIKELSVILFLIIQIIIFFNVWKHYEVNTYFRNIDKAWAIIGSYAIQNIILSKMFGAYDVGKKRTIDILFGQYMKLIICDSLAYLQLCMLHNYPYMYSIKVLGLITIINCLIMTIGILILRAIYYLLSPIQSAILITTNDDSLMKDLSHNKLNKRIKIDKIVRFNKNDLEIKQLKNQLKDYNVVIVDDIPPFMRNNILKYCYETNKKCYAKPKVSDVLIRSATITRLCYNSMLMYDDPSITFWQAVLKRTFDVVCSAIALVFLIPLFIIVGIIIKLTDGGPIFYVQNRYTKDKKVFKIYKFRSMYVNNQNSACLATKNDKRITPIGSILRRTHIDELPQVINILKGDMSIVGPRPDMLEIYEVYKDSYPEYDYRLKMKAGLTGYAQIYGKYNTSPQDKLKFDMIYICNYSFMLDIKLILLTFKVMFAKDTSEGLEEGKTNALKDKDKK